MNKRISIFIIVGLMMGLSQSWAQEQNPEVNDSETVSEKKPAPEKPIKVKKKTVRVNFEDQLVQAGSEKPEVEYIFEKSQFNYRKLIRLRENFKPEVQGGMEEMNAGE